VGSCAISEDWLTSIRDGAESAGAARVEALRSTGTLIKAGKTLSYAEADVRTSAGRLVAHGTSTLMRLPGVGVKLGIPLWAE
jgi:hypothetical protein